MDGIKHKKMISVRPFIPSTSNHQVGVVLTMVIASNRFIIIIIYLFIYLGFVM
jgi:hypothetical protein